MGQHIRTYIGVCSEAKPIAPFQYYSVIGEKIVKTVHYSHGHISVQYEHIMPDGSAIAEIRLRDSSKLMSSGANPIQEVQENSIIEVSFPDLLAEMHLCSRYSGQTFDPSEIHQILKLFSGGPIIIGGCGRSGTTLLLAILGAHPKVYAFKDEMYGFYPEPFRLHLIKMELESAARNGDWTHWCEKTPKNVQSFGAIVKAFGNRVSLIHMVRDGRDVITSHHPNDESTYYISKERWIADVEAGLEYGEQSLIIRYEDLVTMPHATISEICKYVGIDFDARLANYQDYSSVQENKAWEGRKAKPLDSSRVGRWSDESHAERIADFLSDPRSTALMRRLGYI